ncbi:hypothetical protein OBV_13240 [Oscillibacter valericigenes Sjm18-20]|nr:hypothetical protein OBV_13240 [Oscillibacter valericigenes Sjm18-20]
MEHLILDMMTRAGIRKAELKGRGKISANFSQTLGYLCWVREHPMNGWSCPTAILV